MARRARAGRACLFALATLADGLLARHRAATRRGVWALAIAVALVLPLSRLALAAPAIEVAPWLALASLAIWASGALVLLLRLAIHVQRARRLRETSEPLMDPAWLASLRALHGPAVDLHSGDELASPVVVGVWRPVIVVPRTMLAASATERRSLLAHELAHVARADCLLLLAGGVVRAIYWVTPLPWWALRSLRARAEDAADDAALRTGIRSSSYAAQLLALARKRLGAVGQVRADGLRARVRAILDARRVRSRQTTWGQARWSVPGLVAAGALLATMVTACEARSAPQADDHAALTRS